MAAYTAHTTNKYSSPNRSNKQTKDKSHKNSLPFGTGGLAKKGSGEWVQKQKKDKTERATGLHSQGRPLRHHLLGLIRLVAVGP